MYSAHLSIYLSLSHSFSDPYFLSTLIFTFSRLVQAFIQISVWVSLRLSLSVFITHSLSLPLSLSQSITQSVSIFPSSPSVVLRGLHGARLLQRHGGPDGLWRPLPEVDGVPRLRPAVPGQRAGRPQLLQEPRPRVQPLVLLQAELRGHRMGLLRLPPGYAQEASRIHNQS